MRDMRHDDRIYVPADKTRNFYRMTKEAHKNLLLKNITNEYKKSSDDIVDKINKTDKELVENLDISDRVYSLSRRNAFITIKDHKDNYLNNTKCRLINTAKTEVGKVSKRILTRVVTSLREKTKLNQWNNSFSVIEWFKNLENKSKLSFIQFDIVEFYPSITENLLKSSLNWAKSQVNLSKEEIHRLEPRQTLRILI